MKVPLYNQKREEIGTVSVPDELFNTIWRPELVHQAMVAQQANSRQRIAASKGRSEVRGGGRKPWRQKGTGRARHGSIRSPLWRGGGVTFGPASERKYAKKINKQMRRKALFSVLSKKMRDGEVFVIDSLSLPEVKTKIVASLYSTLVHDGKSTLFIPKAEYRIFHQMVRNIPSVDAVSPLNLSIIDCLHHAYIIFDKEAVNELAEHYQGFHARLRGKTEAVSVSRT